MEYLESTGTQYIDLGIKGTNNSRYDFKFHTVDAIVGRGIFGYFGNTANYYLYSSNPGLFFQVGYKTYSDTNLKIESGEDYIVTNDKNKIHINDYLYELPEADSFETSGNLLLFNLGGGNYSGLPIRLYYFKLYDGEQLIRDLIPVLDKEKRPCMFDKVSKTYFYNQGTGKFSYFIPRKKFDLFDNQGGSYYNIEFLESSGTQYIDLGIKGTNNSRYDFKFHTVDAIVGRGIFGYFGNTANYYLYSSNPELFFQVGYKTYSNTNLKIQSGGDYIVTNDKNKIHINDYLYELPEADSFETSGNLLLFNLGGGNYSGLPIRLYYFKLYDDDQLVRDLVPALDIKYRPCMFDKVSKTCFYNQGTGEFIYG